MVFPDSSVKNLLEMQDTSVRSLGWEDPLEKVKGYPLQCSGLENSMDCIVHAVAKSQTGLNDFHFQTVAFRSLQVPLYLANLDHHWNGELQSWIKLSNIKKQRHFRSDCRQNLRPFPTKLWGSFIEGALSFSLFLCNKLLLNICMSQELLVLLN